MLQKMLDHFEETFHKTVSNAYFKLRVRYVLLGTFIFSMVANGFAYLNFYPQHDSINHVFRTASNWEVRLGRFLHPFYAQIRGQITMPWLIGILSMLFIAITVFLVCDMLDIKNKYQIFLTAGFLSANVTITQMCAVFIYIDDIYMAALMLATLGVWMVQKLRGCSGVVCAAICFGVSMGLYQAYMVVAVILFMLLISKEFMLRKPSWKECFVRWGEYIVSIIVGGSAYYILWQQVLRIYNVEAATGVNSIAQLKNVTFATLIEQTKMAYINFLNFFVGNNVVLGSLAKYSTILLMLLAVVAIMHYIRMKRVPFYNYILVAFIVICYPLVTLITSIVMGKDNIDFITSFGLCLVHPILLMIILGLYKQKNKFEAISRVLAMILSMVVLFANITFSNGAYMTSKIMYDRTLSVMTRILEDIDATEGFILNETEVVVIGVDSPENINIPTEKYESMRAFKSLSVSYTQTFKSFANLLGYDMKYTNDLSDINLAYVEYMPCYPYEGYCQMVDGKMVVKFR